MRGDQVYWLLAQRWTFRSSALLETWVAQEAMMMEARFSETQIVAVCSWALSYSSGRRIVEDAPYAASSFCVV